MRLNFNRLEFPGGGGQPVSTAVTGAAVPEAASVARYFDFGTGLVFLALQRGHDVHLPQYTELIIDVHGAP
jgi:hypothetical protein